MTEAPKSLRAYVEIARAQEAPVTGVTAEAVLAGVERQRRKALARRSVAISASVAVAASVLAVVSLSTWLGPRDIATPVATLQPETATERELPPPQLANAVTLRTNASVEIHGPWSIALGSGVHELEMQPTAGRALRISLPDRELELVEGRAVVDVSEDGSVVELEDGVAAWIGDDGERTQITVEHAQITDDLPPPETAEAPETVETVETVAKRPRKRSARSLAREAEAHLEAGERDEAIALLRKLVDTHPRAGLARTALLDLGHLLRKARRRGEARCAYALYLERWPDSPVEPEVQRQLDRLRGKVRCDGLDPL